MVSEAAKVDDFIVSEHLISLMMAQLSENSELLGVFTDMFDPEGSEIYLKPMSDYVAFRRPVNFQTVIEAARRRNETAIGYRIMSEAGSAEKRGKEKSSPSTRRHGVVSKKERQASYKKCCRRKFFALSI